MLRDEILWIIVDETMQREKPPLPNVAADRVLALFRDRLLSDEAIQAMAQAAMRHDMPWLIDAPVMVHQNVADAYRAGIAAALDAITA